MECYDNDNGMVYYYNTITHAASWEVPSEMQRSMERSSTQGLSLAMKIKRWHSQVRTARQCRPPVPRHLARHLAARCSVCPVCPAWRPC